ncbi:SMP-30/gluconolactonase/LRE family protein [Jeotgalibaca caeni]|uniref:SMP-30/gluconolactonase/LRE family protein n=1 Tax=Jeotgalibaca caeni TaxID=3028623 RepID=UPI00237DA981|nr:SMP-30/gluconolactonase/LRE family protein [Jeotgalibaca caeni]MDE1548326.1 SMP-30/gluconolactonase/LRE family protein [Jeotgalibaca caeni]
MSQGKTAELVFYAGASLLEGPHWDEKNQLLYVVSIEDHFVYAIDPATGAVESYPTDGPVGCAVIDEDGMILEAEQDGIFRIDSKTKEKHFVSQPRTDDRMRFNDGKLDPKGRLLVGTMGLEGSYEGEANLYAVEKDGSFKTVIEGVTLSNGLAWTEDGKTMYFIDTPTKKVGQYAYDVASGTATFEKYVVEITDGSSPDGMCIEPDGTIWVAQYGGHKVSHWNPATGEKLGEVKVPAKNVTSCCIGGAKMDYLYITTAKDGELEEAMSGGLFRVKL